MKKIQFAKMVFVGLVLVRIPLFAFEPWLNADRLADVDLILDKVLYAVFAVYLLPLLDVYEDYIERHEAENDHTNSKP